LLIGICDVSLGRDAKRLKLVIKNKQANTEIKAWAQLFKMISEIPSMNQEKKEKVFLIFNSIL
jgi:hypothetical protein